MSERFAVESGTDGASKSGEHNRRGITNRWGRFHRWREHGTDCRLNVGTKYTLRPDNDSGNHAAWNDEP